MIFSSWRNQSVKQLIHTTGQEKGKGYYVEVKYKTFF